MNLDIFDVIPEDALTDVDTIEEFTNIFVFDSDCAVDVGSALRDPFDVVAVKSNFIFDIFRKANGDAGEHPDFWYLTLTEEVTDFDCVTMTSFLVLIEDCNDNGEVSENGTHFVYKAFSDTNNHVLYVRANSTNA